MNHNTFCIIWLMGVVATFNGVIFDMWGLWGFGVGIMFSIMYFQFMEKRI